MEILPLFHVINITDVIVNDDGDRETKKSIENVMIVVLNRCLTKSSKLLRSRKGRVDMQPTLFF